VITVEEAISLILDNPGEWGITRVSLVEAWGRILAEPLAADRDFPPFARVSMDGIAIDYDAFASGRRRFPVRGMQAAGMAPLQLGDPEGCLEIMTGAILPGGTDTVIRYEDLEMKEGRATVLTEDVRKGQNVHPRGADRRQGEQIVAPGVRLGGAELGLAAAVGKSTLQVRANPRVALLASGDELVDIDAEPLPHQVRISNIYALQGLFQSWGIPCGLFHITDERDEILRSLGKALEDFDALVLSGGVSAGKFDYVPEVLEELGVSKIFHKVKQRPGMPFWFGAGPGKTVFALPGNPVASFMCTIRYIQPWLRASLSMAPLQPLFAVLEEDVTFNPSLTYFLPVRLRMAPDGTLHAQPRPGHGSGDLSNLTEADGFLELPPARNTFARGEAFPLWQYRTV